jgi:glycerol-1-phosphate dehydrogenase [NAD(P)+]
MKTIQIGHDLITDLSHCIRSLTPGRRILLISDNKEILYRGQPIKPMILHVLSEEFSIEHLVIEHHKPDEDIHAEMGYIPEITDRILGAGKNRQKSVDCVVAVGSGTITDLSKYALHQSGVDIPLLVVQTMLSVNAFTDGVSVLFEKGVKRTLPSRYPTALVLDLDLVREAPLDRTLSGYGDLLATWSAPADWYLSHTLGMTDNYHEAPHSLMAAKSLELLEQSENLGQKKLVSIQLLAETLTLSGMAMGIAGESSPASGTEHTISHLLDMRSSADGRSLAYHGAQVAISTLFSACAWDIFINEFDPEIVDLETCFPNPKLMESRVQRAFEGLSSETQLTQSCWDSYSRKLLRWSEQRTGLRQFLSDWNRIRIQLQGMLLKPEYLVESLGRAGAPRRYSQLLPPVTPEKAHWAILNCHLYRDRFTLADLLFFLGWWNEDFIKRLFSRLEKSGAGL